MEWQGFGADTKLLAWLEAASAARTPDRDLDPFATSMRDFDDVAVDLVALLAGKEAKKDWAQRLTDLKHAGLVGEDRKIGDLGKATIAAWQSFGVATDDKEHELPRHLLYVLEGQRLKAEPVVSYIEYWKDLRANFRTSALINNWDSLFALNYLDYERAEFAPGTLLRGKGFEAEDIELGLLEFVDAAGASPAARDGAQKVENAHKGQIPRGRYRATFAMALEIALSGQAAAEKFLAEFGTPTRPRGWKAFEGNTRDIVLAIISKYQIASAPSSEAE